MVGAIPIAYLYYWAQEYYIPTSRALKRLDSVSRSPIFSGFEETLVGVETIRSFSESGRFIHVQDERVNTNSRAYYLKVWKTVVDFILCFVDLCLSISIYLFISTYLSIYLSTYLSIYVST